MENSSSVFLLPEEHSFLSERKMIGFLSLKILGKSSMLAEMPDEGRMQSMKTTAFLFFFLLRA